MLPSSHNPSIIKPGLEALSSEMGVSLFPSEQFSSFNHAGGAQTAASAHALADAFANFVSASSCLEGAYRELQVEVSGLRLELEHRNAALKESLSENQRVRTALQQIVDSMPCGVLVVNSTGELTTINPEARRMLHLHKPSSSLHSLADIESSLGFEHVLTNLGKRGADTEQEFCWQSPAGERWLHVLVRQIVTGESLRANNPSLFIVRDITSQKREEQDREATRNAAVLAEITTMLAHEIRNPLASLELFANLIEQDAAGRDEWIANLRAGIRTLSGTVNNVLSLHDAGRLQLMPLDLNDLVGRTVRFAKPLADQAGTSLVWSGDVHNVDILGSNSALQQVLLNLIRNAIRHTNAGGSITLSGEHLNGNLMLHCTDTGPGISAAQLPHIFEAGFSGSGDSPGLGLAVCRRIMKQHGGMISVANVSGSGARFTLTFPILKEESKAA